MTQEQLKRLDLYNWAAKQSSGLIPYTDYARFAILSERERDEHLDKLEKVVTKVLKHKEIISRN